MELSANSPASIGRDRGGKFLEYREGGVPEYWLVDPLAQSLELYQKARRWLYISTTLFMVVLFYGLYLSLNK